MTVLETVISNCTVQFTFIASISIVARLVISLLDAWDRRGERRDRAAAQGQGKA